MPSRVEEFFHSFCSQRGINPDDRPLAISLPRHDEDDMRHLLIPAVVMVFESYGFNLGDISGLSVLSPKGSIIATLGDGTQRLMIESYEEAENRIVIANRLFYDAEIKRQFTERYNLPFDVSEDFLMVYLAAHGAVHAVQKKQNRMERNPAGRYDSDTEVKNNLELVSEKEAHNIGIRIADEIWYKTIGREV